MAEELHINCHICQKEMPYVALSDDLYRASFAYTTSKGTKLRTYLCPDCMKKVAKYIEKQQKIIKEDRGMHFNLNKNVKVKLTDFGKDIFYHHVDELNDSYGRQVCKPTMPEVDEDGYTTFQLWHFMELYGNHMGMCKPNVIEPLEIVFETEKEVDE